MPFVLAVIAAVLALAGAPANTVVVCNPSLAFGGETHLGNPSRIELQVWACSSLLIAGASRTERAKIRALNPDVNLDERVGVGLLIVLHEAFHAALRSGDETLVECHAIASIQTLLRRYGLNPSLDMEYARAYDGTLPADYKRGC